MFGLPDDFDSSFLLGRTLHQVCFGLHQVILRFDAEVDLSIECDYRVTIDGHAVPYSSSLAGSAALLTFLHLEVISTRSSADGTLAVAFEGGTLELYDSSPQYESYQIRNGDDLYVV